MNLNENKRFENFEITEDEDFCEYFKRFFDVSFESIPTWDKKGDIDKIDAFNSLNDFDLKQF